ncbi:hypothetical protein BH09BAC1_BH09BAC1_04650 [soil metagenome]
MTTPSFSPEKVDIVPGYVFTSERGSYKTIKELGEGGFGSVYLVESNGRKFALKITKMWNFLPQERQEYAKRFRQEYEHSSNLDSEYLVRSHDFHHVGGNPYMVMDLCPGGSVRDKVGESLPNSEINRIAYGILKGLSALHSKGIIHRDIKPENILFNEQDNPALADFGISASIKKRHTITNFRGHAKQVFATGTYSPPEQSDPTKAFKVMGNTNDIYAFGIVMYELLTKGMMPFGDFEAYIADMAGYEQRKKLGQWDKQSLERSGADRLWVEVVEKCLKPEATERYQFADDIIAKLNLSNTRQHKQQIQVLPHHQWVLKVMNGDEIGRSYNLSNLLRLQGKTLLTIGWFNPDDPFTNDVGIVEQFTNYVSNFHATMEYDKASNYWYIRDGQWRTKEGVPGWYRSTNGVLVNSMPVDDRGTMLQPDDIVTIGDTTIQVGVI